MNGVDFMQLTIYQRLNRLLLALLASIILIIIIIVLNFKKLEDFKIIVFIAFMIYSVGSYFLFKMLEVNWDKRLIQKMAMNNQIVIANIKKAEALMHSKDSSGKHYILWQLTVDAYDHDLKRQEMTLVEKMNDSLTSVPNGTIYITYNPEKPKELFVIPNVMISHLPQLQPIVEKYEKARSISIRYLNVYYKDGMIIETYQDSMKRQSQNEPEKNDKK